MRLLNQLGLWMLAAVMTYGVMVIAKFVDEAGNHTIAVLMIFVGMGLLPLVLMECFDDEGDK